MAWESPGCILGGMDGSPTDEEVVARCLAGESDAFAIIVRRYQARFLRLAAFADWHERNFRAVVIALRVILAALAVSLLILGIYGR